MEIIFHSHTNKTHFHKKGCAPSLILKVRVFGTLKWPIAVTVVVAKAPYKHEGDDSENVTYNTQANSRCFELHRYNSTSVNLSKFGEFFSS